MQQELEALKPVLAKKEQNTQETAALLIVIEEKRPAVKAKEEGVGKDAAIATCPI